MIKKIRLMLEYNTYCIWLYDENGDIIDNDNPPEWDDDQELTDAFMAVSDCTIRSSSILRMSFVISAVLTKKQESVSKISLIKRSRTLLKRIMGNTRFRTILAATFEKTVPFKS